MKTINKPCYRCEYCRKLYEIKNYAESHESNCKKNPINARPCFYCDQVEMKSEEFYFDTDYGDDSRVVKAVYCKAKKVFIYPPSVGRSDQGPYEFGDIANVPMPKTCDIFTEWLLKQKKDGWSMDYIPENVIGE